MPEPEPTPQPQGGRQQRYSAGSVVGWAFLTLVALIVLEVALIIASSLVYSVLPSSVTSGVQATAYPSPMLSASPEGPVPDPYVTDPYADPYAIPYDPYSASAAPDPTYVPPPGSTPEYAYPDYEQIYPDYQPTFADRVSNVFVWASGFGGLVTGILAIVLLPRAASVRARSRWLGILIGSAIHLIAFGGLCVVYLSGF